MEVDPVTETKREGDKEGDGVDVHLREKETREGDGEVDYPALLSNSLKSAGDKHAVPTHRPEQGQQSCCA